MRTVSGSTANSRGSKCDDALSDVNGKGERKWCVPHAAVQRLEVGIQLIGLQKELEATAIVLHECGIARVVLTER